MDDEKHPLGDSEMDEETRPFVNAYKSKANKCLICLLISTCLLTVLLLLSIGAIIGLSLTHGKAEENDNTSSSCNSPSCVQLAAVVMKNMNPNIDPCEDFYNYSCGGWVARNAIPSGNGAWGVFEELDKQNEIYLKKLLEGNEENDVAAIKLTRELYSSCMNIDSLTNIGSSPLIEVINSTGGWSLVDVHNGSASAWALNSSDFELSKRYGNGAFFSFGTSVNDKNSSETIAVLSQSGITLPSQEAYLNENQTNQTIPALREYIVSTLMLLNPSGNIDELTQAANQIIDLETDLAKIFVSNVELRNIDKSYNVYTLDGNLSDGTLWSQFNWSSYITNLLNSSGVSVSSDLVVIVRTPSYFRNLTDVYSKYNDSVLENYFKWQLIEPYIKFLGSEFLDNYYTYTSIVLGSGEVDRYLTCISYLETFVPFSLSRLYTIYVLPNGTKGNVSEMVKEVKDAFKERLSENKWLDDRTRERSIWKVGNITQMIAYPDAIYNETLLLKEAKIVDLTNGSLFYSVVLYQIAGYEGNLRQLGKPVDKTGWELAPTEVNAYYEPLFNQFVFLEGILNEPFLNADWPEYFKYGAFGVVIGHELTHGFDDQGQRYDQNGVLTPWWTNNSIREFKERTKCFVDQYSKYSVFGNHINGNLTLGENIADNGGIKTAFQAYKNVVKGKKLPSLPGVDLSADELFFVAFGQVWCSLFSPEFITSNLQTNPHSPGPYRVIGALSNSEDFADTFKCREGERMNPTHKCDLW